MEVGGIFRNKGYTNVQLMLMFYLICVPLRLSIAYLVWKFGERVDMLGVVLVVGVMGIIMNMRAMMRNEKVWWLREFHLLIAIGVAITAGMSLYYGGIDRAVFRNVLVGLLVTDVAAGVLTSLVRKPFL